MKEIKQEDNETSSEIDPREDGVTHINIYSRSSSKLGRALSNFAHSTFVHPKYGRFESIEAFWYWAGTGKQHDSLKLLYGFRAKSEGKRFEKIPYDNFIEEVKEAILYKLQQNSWISDELFLSTLPFKHYYVYGDIAKTPTVRIPEDSQWLCEFFSDIRMKGLSHLKQLILLKTQL